MKKSVGGMANCPLLLVAFGGLHFGSFGVREVRSAVWQNGNKKASQKRL